MSTAPTRGQIFQIERSTARQYFFFGKDRDGDTIEFLVQRGPAKRPLWRIWNSTHSEKIDGEYADLGEVEDALTAWLAS